MIITILSSSTRKNSESRNVSKYLSSVLESMSVKSSVIDLHELSLPLYDATEEGEWKAGWDSVSSQLEKSDGFVFVSPEWDGMFSAGLHNLFHYIKLEMADKPVYLVGVSSGRGGRYPILQMRGFGYKNKHFVIIPESLFIDDVMNNLVDGEMKNTHIKKRSQYGLKILVEYSKALGSVRKSGVLDYENFKNGW